MCAIGFRATDWVRGKAKRRNIRKLIHRALNPQLTLNPKTLNPTPTSTMTVKTLGLHPRFYTRCIRITVISSQPLGPLPHINGICCE